MKTKIDAIKNYDMKNKKGKRIFNNNLMEINYKFLNKEKHKTIFINSFVLVLNLYLNLILFEQFQNLLLLFQNYFYIILEKFHQK